MSPQTGATSRLAALALSAPRALIELSLWDGRLCVALSTLNVRIYTDQVKRIRVSSVNIRGLFF